MIDFTSKELQQVVDGGDERALRARALGVDYRASPLRASTLAVAAILLYPRSSPAGALNPKSVVRGTAYGRWVERLRAAGDPRAFTLLQWCTAYRAPVALYPIFLFNRDFGQSRRVLRMLLAREKRPPPYLWLVVLNMLHGVLGLSHTDLHRLVAGPFDDLAAYVRRLFDDTKLAEEWLASKRQPLRFYGGATNTVLGLYDGLFADARTGARRLRKRSAFRFDLGGGFATSEIERLTGAPFVSADILSPAIELYDPELVIHVAGEQQPIPADDATREAHLARQRGVAHMPFDVLTDSFPTHAKSYTIVSTGFMTSTVRPLGRVKAWKGTRLGHVGLSVHAIHRVVELAALGKDVDLFTIQRATSRAYEHKTCFLRWRDGRLVTLVTTRDTVESGLSSAAASLIARMIGAEVPPASAT